MFEVDNQDHEDQRRELLTLLRATTVITSCPWIFMGCLLARYGGQDSGDQNQSMPLELL